MTGGIRQWYSFSRLFIFNYCTCHYLAFILLPCPEPRPLFSPQVRLVRKETKRYEGEVSGIKSHTIKSIKIK